MLKSLLSAFTQTQNAPVKLRGRYEMNFKAEQNLIFFGGFWKTFVATDDWKQFQ